MRTSCTCITLFRRRILRQICILPFIFFSKYHLTRQGESIVALYVSLVIQKRGAQIFPLFFFAHYHYIYKSFSEIYTGSSAKFVDISIHLFNELARSVCSKIARRNRFAAADHVLSVTTYLPGRRCEPTHLRLYFFSPRRRSPNFVRLRINSHRVRHCLPCSDIGGIFEIHQMLPRLAHLRPSNRSFVRSFVHPSPRFPVAVSFPRNPTRRQSRSTKRTTRKISVEYLREINASREETKKDRRRDLRARVCPPQRKISRRFAGASLSRSDVSRTGDSCRPPTSPDRGYIFDIQPR